MSIPRILEQLDGIKEVTMLFPGDDASDGEPLARTSITALSAEQRQLYELLDLNRYQQI